jgi:glycosyltransferase involved in cell wall biosynthesis
MIKVYGMMVVKNEADRYLSSCLANNQEYFDDIFVYDDQSTDSTVETCKKFNCVTISRQDSHPSFLEDEGAFRYNAWREFERAMKPAENDWIFAFDADEFIIGEPGDLRKAVRSATMTGPIGIIIPFNEIFHIAPDGHLWERTDGFWGSIQGPRLFKYKRNSLWRDKKMGCGSEPEHIQRGPLTNQNLGIKVLHLGYAAEKDRIDKYERYSAIEHGHSDKHIQSIPAPPKLEPTGIYDWELYLGERNE